MGFACIGTVAMVGGIGPVLGSAQSEPAVHASPEPEPEPEPTPVDPTVSVELDSRGFGGSDHFDRVLAEPVPNISPPAEFGTLVNLGLWIAVDDPGVVTDTASDGPVWAQGTGTHTRITVDFGNGDRVVCEGLGTPIRDTNIREQGPCGYTFTKTNRPSPTYPVTLTSTYTVTYRLSTGESGVLGTVDRDIGFDYEVTQVQAVGTG